MKFTTPATVNPIDQMKVVGQPVDRIDGKLKVTGTAPYAYEQHRAAPQAAYGYVLGAAIARGRIASIDSAAAQRSPGVLAVLTHENAGATGKGAFNAAKLLGGPAIEHYHQAVALVVANTFEQARAAAALVRIDYVRQPGSFDLAASRQSAAPSGKDSLVGDFEQGYAAAPVKLDATYTTPDQSHAMMEPHATTASWDGAMLTVWTSTQVVDRVRTDLARTLGLAPDHVHVMSPYTGGGFGAKLFLRTDAVLAALGAKAAGRPVKVALQRPLIANNTTHRPATVQRIRIGATREGRISAIAHESWSGNLPGGKPESAVNQTRLLYAGPHRMSGLRLATLDLPEGNSMRAPGEAAGLMALEIAIDEMAEKLKMDPVTFRIVNDTTSDPEKPGRKFSQRQFVECMRQGAERFGWKARLATPGAVREGRWLIGMGVASAFRNNLNSPSGARASLERDGTITIATDMTDIGTGSYTIIGQTAAEMLGVPLARVRVLLGDSDYPVSSGSGGQRGANSSTAGVYAACALLRDAIAAQAGMDPLTAAFADGNVSAGGRSVPLRDVAKDGVMTVEDKMEYGDLAKEAQQSTFGAHFVEVGVDMLTAEIRVRRMLAVCAAGRILNPKTARSQVIGAMTMGVGAALMEELAVDRRHGFFVNHDLAGYEVPVHADIPHQDVIFLGDPDPMTSPMKAKGVGELGLCGVSAAIANAVYNATGIRVRAYPVTLDKMLDKMPVYS